MTKKSSLKKKKQAPKKDRVIKKGFEQISPGFFSRFVEKGMEMLKV